jgi:hypothetical protein
MTPTNDTRFVLEVHGNPRGYGWRVRDTLTDEAHGFGLLRAHAEEFRDLLTKFHCPPAS